MIYICVQVPLQDVSLAPEVVVVLDHHTHIFIWSGSKVYAASACTHTHTHTHRISMHTHTHTASAHHLYPTI